MPGFDFNSVPRWAQIDADAFVRFLSGTPILWSRLPGGSSAAFLHSWLSRRLWHDANPLARLRCLAGLALLPVATAVVMLPLTRSNAAMVRRRTGKGVLRQLREQFLLSIRDGVLPPWYFMFELYEDDRRSRVREYLHRFETKTLLYPYLRQQELARTGLPDTSRALSNKVMFADLCRSAGIRCVPVLMHFSKERPVDGSPMDLPREDIFLKPKRGTGGEGAERWDYLPDGSYENAAGERLDPDGMRQHIASLSRQIEYLVQPRLRNHPDIADLSTGALITARMVTCRDERGGFEVTHAMFRMALGEASVVDNFHAGGVAAKVDLDTGVIGSATDGGLYPNVGWLDRHPVTGAQIVGRRLPLWQEALDLAVRAHAAFPDSVAIGWDVALLEDGPCLVEGNKGPDLDIVQRTHCEPVGNSRLGQLLAFHLQQTMAQAPAAAPAVMPA